MKDSRRNREKQRKAQEEKCWEEYSDYLRSLQKTPAQISSEEDKAWEEYFASQALSVEEKFVDVGEVEEDFNDVDETEEAEEDMDDESFVEYPSTPDMRIYKKRKKTATCHKATVRKAKEANANIRRREEDNKKHYLSSGVIRAKALAKKVAKMGHPIE